MDGVRGDFKGPPHGRTQTAVIANAVVRECEVSKCMLTFCCMLSRPNYRTL